jgi:hypothetical protein
MRYRFMILISLLILSACGGKKTPDPNSIIDQAVAATLSAMPTPTSQPISTPYPSPTPFTLNGLFCEYQFCIGHPADMAFYDVSAVKSNQATPSTYQTGLMAAYSGSLVIELIWQFSPGTADPSFLLNTVMQQGVDTPTGTQEIKRIRDMNVVYTAITTTATPILPNGAAAAWTCGDRVFAWKVYAPDAGAASTLFDSTLARFRCNQ